MFFPFLTSRTSVLMVGIGTLKALDIRIYRRDGGDLHWPLAWFLTKLGLISDQ